jgi:hypothetical protein
MIAGHYATRITRLGREYIIASLRLTVFSERFMNVVSVGRVAATLTVIGSALFILWIGRLTQIYLREVGGWCGTVIGGITEQLILFAPWWLLLLYLTTEASVRLNVVPTIARRCYQAAVTCWIALFLGMLLTS